MRKITVITLCLTALFAVQACNSGKAPAKPEGMPQGLHDSMSTAVALFVYNEIIKNQLGVPEVNYDLLAKTMKKLNAGKEIGFTMEEAGQIFQNYMMKKQELNQKKGTEFLAKNKTKKDVIELESGLQYKMIEEGTGIQPSAIDTVVVNYKGTLIDGTEFDSSEQHGQAATFPLNRVMPGWTEGLQLIKEGGKAILYIPSDLGYGANGYGPQIPGNSTLIFEVELLEVKKAATQPENE